MAVKTEDLMTPQQLNDNYEYKVTKRVLIREFPWIKDVSFDEDEINKYNLIFLDLYIDPFELSNETGWAISKWALREIGMGEIHKSLYVSSLMKVSYEESMGLIKKIEKTINSIHSSPAIPKELRLPGNRRLVPGNFITQPNLTLPTSYVDWAKTIKDSEHPDWDRTIDTIEEL